MKTRTFASIAVISALGLLAPIHAHAFGLGKIKLSSALNQPFYAEIPVTALKPDDEGNLQVQLASNAEFEKAGLKRSFLLTQLQFEVVETKGSAKIIVSSSQPVKEPFIDFLLTATTGTGKLIREYTVLLDPPKSVFAKPKVATKQKTTKVEQQTAPKTTTYNYSAPDVSDSSTQSYSSATSYGPVGRSDTLWDIAKSTKPSSSISQNQMMMAILSANRTAFRNNNINGLKAGYTLDIPSVNEIQSLSKKQATSAVKEQNELWKNRKKVVTQATIVEEQVESTATSQEELSSEQMEKDSAVIATDMSSEQEEGARLQLVSPTDEELSEMDELSPLGSDELSEVREQLTLAQETIESQAQENIDIQSRMALMEEQLQTLRQLITLKDADLARLQSSLEAGGDSGVEELNTENTTEPLEQASVESDSPSEKSFDADMEGNESEVDSYFAQLENGDTVDPSSASDDDLDMFVEPSDEPLETVSPANDAQATYLDAVKEAINTAVVSVKTFYAEHKKESLITGLIAALLALILLLFRARGRKEERVWTEEKSPTETTIAVAETEDNGQAEVVESASPEKSTSESAVETDEAIIKAAYASIDTGDIDSSSEPEANNSESEETLTVDENDTEVLADEVENIDPPALEPEIEEIEPLELEVNFPDDEVSSLEPEESNTDSTVEFNVDLPSEEAEESIAVEDKAEPTVDDDLLNFNVDSLAEEDTSLSIDSESKDNETLDFSEPFTEEAGDKELDGLTLDDESLSLDTELVDIKLDDTPIEEADLANEAFSIDLDLDSEMPTLSVSEGEENDEFTLTESSLDIDTPTSSVEPKLEEQAQTEESDELEFDLGDFDEIDEAETKLDLAGAYMDMGDPEGARNILEEVLIDGSDDQKSRAEALLNDLS